MTDYLENVVLHVIDLDLLPGASTRPGRRQKRLEPEIEEIRSRKTSRPPARVDPCAPEPARVHPPVGGRDQQDSVAVERLPLHHKGHVRHLPVVQEMGVCRKTQV